MVSAISRARPDLAGTVDGDPRRPVKDVVDVLDQCCWRVAHVRRGRYWDCPPYDQT
jgi:hypothetical protein